MKRFMIGFILLGFLLALGQNAGAVRKETLKSIKTTSTTAVKKTSKKTRGCNKCEKYLNALLRYMTFEQAANAFKSARFSKAETLHLTKSLKNKKYSAKIRVLTKKPRISAEEFVAMLQKNTAKKKHPVNRINLKNKTFRLSPAQKMEFQRLKTKIEQEINRKNREKIRMVNRKADATLMSARSRASQMVQELRSQGVVLPPVSQMSASSTQPVEDMADIDHSRPTEATAGNDLELWGENFGNSGRAFVTIGDLTFELDVDEWTDSNVTVRVPHDVSPLAGNDGIEARFILDTERNRAVYLVRLLPDPESIAPSITSLSNNIIVPGSVIVIEGEHFGSSPGTVRFQIDDLSVSGEILDWEDIYVRVKLPYEVEGVTETANCQINLTTSSGPSATNIIGFTPHRQAAYPAELVNLIEQMAGGRSRRFQLFGYQLINGWTVRARELLRLSVDEDKISNISLPRSGDKDTTSSFRINLSPGEVPEGIVMIRMVFVGPRGVDYR